MSDITVTDPALIEQLRHANGTVLRDPDGRVLGRFTVEPDEAPEALFLPPPGFVSPFTDEQRREFRKQVSGRSHAEVLRDLKARS